VARKATQVVNAMHARRNIADTPIQDGGFLIFWMVTWRDSAILRRRPWAHMLKFAAILGSAPDFRSSDVKGISSLVSRNVGMCRLEEPLGTQSSLMLPCDLFKH
jgi:hypothetical protein